MGHIAIQSKIYGLVPMASYALACIEDSTVVQISHEISKALP